MENNKTLVKKITVDEKERLEELWYTKVAYGDLVVGDSSAPTHIRNSYVEATQEYVEFGDKLIAKYFPGVQPKGWTGNFSTCELSITVA